MDIEEVLADRGLLADLASEYGDVRLTKDPGEREAWLKRRLKEHSLKGQPSTEGVQNEPTTEVSDLTAKSYDPKKYQAEIQTATNTSVPQVDHTQWTGNLTGFVPKFFTPRPKQPPTFCLHGDAKSVNKKPQMVVDDPKLEGDRVQNFGSKPEAYFDTHTAEKLPRDAWGRPLSVSSKPDWVHAVDLHTALQSNEGIPSKHARFQNHRKFAQATAHAKQRVKLMGSKDPRCCQNDHDGFGVDCMMEGGGVDPRVEARLSKIQETVEEQSMRLKEQGDVFQALLDSMAESQKNSKKKMEAENREVSSKDNISGKNFAAPEMSSPRIVVKTRADSMVEQISHSNPTAKDPGNKNPKIGKSMETQPEASNSVEEMTGNGQHPSEVPKSYQGMDATNELLLLAKMANAGGVLGNVLVGSTLRRAVKDWIRSLKKGSKAGSATGIEGLTEIFKILNMQGEANGQRQKGADWGQTHAPMKENINEKKENMSENDRQPKHQAISRGKRKDRSSRGGLQRVNEGKEGTDWDDSTHVDPSLWRSTSSPKNRSGHPGLNSKSQKGCLPGPVIRQPQHSQKQHQQYPSRSDSTTSSKPLHPNDSKMQMSPRKKTLFEQFQDLKDGGSVERAEMESEVLVEPLKDWLTKLEGKMEDWMVGVEQRIGVVDQDKSEVEKGVSSGMKACVDGGIKGKGAELKELLASLEEMESEEERVRKRWLNKNESDGKVGPKSYKGDTSSDKKSTLNTTKAPDNCMENNDILGKACGKISEELRNKQRVETLKEEQKPFRDVRFGALGDRVNEESLTRILKCRRDHVRQQQLSDAILGNGQEDQEIPCPVKIIENIADNFLEDMVKEQLLELEQACDEICEGLFDAEFSPPQ